jgi:hypothetical protein
VSIILRSYDKASRGRFNVPKAVAGALRSLAPLALRCPQKSGTTFSIEGAGSIQPTVSLGFKTVDCARSLAPVLPTSTRRHHSSTKEACALTF